MARLLLCRLLCGLQRPKREPEELLSVPSEGQPREQREKQAEPQQQGKPQELVEETFITFFDCIFLSRLAQAF